MPAGAAAVRDKVDELYEEAIRPLAPADRLKLATRILVDIPPESLSNYSGEWTDEDLSDFSRASWEYINRAIDEE